MSDRVEPEGSSVDEGNDGKPSSQTSRKHPSMLGLSMLSVLNIVCLALITYHVAARASHPAATSEERLISHEIQLTPPPEDAVSNETAATEEIAGNIDFGPASQNVLHIAAGIHPTSEPPAKLVRSLPNQQESSDKPISPETASPKQNEGHWVQLGALSDRATARRFWSSLIKSHPTLLSDRKPQVFSPPEVDGTLHHLRIGPMAENAANGLCKKLTDEGADCFCIRPSAESS